VKNKLAYYDNGSSLFKNNEQIFINKSLEASNSHLHAHDYIEIAYVAAGKGIHSIGDKEYSVSKGDLFIINYDVPHEFRSLECPCEPKLWVYNCVFKPEFLDYNLVNCRDFKDITHHFLFNSFFPEEGDHKHDIKFLQGSGRDIEELYEKMYREYNLKDEGYIEILRAYVIELLITVLRAFRRSSLLSERIENQRRQVIDKIIHHMKDNYKSELKLEELSTLAFLSPSYFCKLFKDCTSMTVSEYLQKIRIDGACDLLRTTNRKIIDISLEIGYKDIKHFNHIFKKITGKTPGEYRKGQNIQQRAF
jgi:AraC family transcriptional regulator, L-rhamnose operon transcriptional activator RhaR